MRPQDENLAEMEDGSESRLESLSGASPFKLLLVLIAAIFLLEGGIMFGLSAIPHRLPYLLENVADATLLTLLLFPVLYFAVFRPLSLKQGALERSERRRRRAQHEVELRIAERTRELNEALARHRAHVDRLVRFNEASQLLFACRDIEELGRVVSSYLNRVLPGQPGAFYVYRTSKDSIQQVICWNGQEGDFPPVITTGHCWALRRGQVHVGGTGDHRLHCGQEACLSALSICLPLFAGDEMLGLVVLRPDWDLSTSANAELASGDRRLLMDAFAESLAVSISNVRLRDSLRTQALRDPLTGLFNRRFIDESLKIELAGAIRRGEAYSVAMIDVDHFKRFNDTYGHEAGDIVLSTLGSHFLDKVRKSDVVCRYGGEEFLVLLPSTPGDEAFSVIDKLRTSMEQLLIPLDNGPKVHVTISCGVAVFPESGDDEASLIGNADRALYKSKKAGRNRTTLWPGNPPAGRSKKNQESAP